jgi:ATP-dependent Lhr-like helicase
MPEVMPSLQSTLGYQVIQQWLAGKGFSPFAFQEEAWQYIIEGRSGLVNAPTGCGKTFSVFLGAVIQFINNHPNDYLRKKNTGLQLLWVTPLRALAKDIGRAMEQVVNELGMQWRIGIRNGDTDTGERQKQKRNMPEVLIITPESMHLLLTQKGYPEFFKTLKIVAVDEWHEIIGSKRGVLVELAISRIVNCRLPDASNQLPVADNCQPSTFNFQLSLWGISATIGNLEQAKEVLLSPLKLNRESVIVKANLHKQIHVESILPDEIERYPWAGHLGLTLAEQVIPIIEQSNTTLIFINTRGMSERWYQKLLDIAPQLAGAIALHHGSIEHELRNWVEEALHVQKLKAVVCTASLDLGVDFRPVDTVIQVGSPKGVARFLQRAGRSGHGPGETSHIYFLPTHSLELVEAAALKAAIKEEVIESREPMLLCFDVLTQYLCTIAIGEGFKPDEIFKEVKSTYCFADITEEEYLNILHYITKGGDALAQYDEYKKVEIGEDGIHRIKNRGIAMRHRMHIGTIVSDAMLKVKMLGGSYVGMIEEYFISRLSPGDVFTLAGRTLELVGIKDMTVITKKSNAKKSIVPSWNGGRMPLSANLGVMLRQAFNMALAKGKKPVELSVLRPLFELQQELSHIPKVGELLIEQIVTRDGYHLFVYPFEGRLVHEAMAALIAYRISRITPITFSIAMNDYGFELLSDQPIPVDDSNVYELFTTQRLMQDIQASVNSVEMARRKFRDIAVIGGLIFQGYPGEHKKARHLQASASLLFNVFSEYDSTNLLLRQAYQEVFDQQMEEVRLRNALQRIQGENIILTFPDRLTPFCFPIKVDSMRENLTSEKLEDRIQRMQAQLEKM